MLQSHGLRAASGGSDYIPPEPGEYDPLIGGYFAGHMTYQQPVIYGSGVTEIYQLWVSPKSMETSRLSSLSSVGPSSYTMLRANSQQNGYFNDSLGYRGTFSTPSGFRAYTEDQWYIPAYQELQQIFRYLKPRNDQFVQSGTTSGSNPTYTWYRNTAALPRWYPENGGSASADPYGTGYPPDPFIVNNTDFHQGGSEALEIEGYYKSSTIVDQTSIPVKANNKGRVVINMSQGLILAPYYIQDFYNTGTSTYDLNFYGIIYVFGQTPTVGPADPMLHTRYVKRKRIYVSVESIIEYYETYDPVRFSLNSSSTKGRFASDYSYDYNFFNI